MHILLSEVVFQNNIVFDLMLSSEATNCHAVSNWERLFTFNVIEKFGIGQTLNLLIQKFGVDQRNSLSHYSH